MDSKDESKLTREKNWSVMVYMAGDNNLSEEMVWALQEINEYFTDNPTKVDLSAQFDGMGAYPRRYRFRRGAVSPPEGESDGSLRRYRNEKPPLGGRDKEDLISAGNLRDQELDSIGRIALDKAHRPGEFPAALDDDHVGIFRGIPDEVEQGPSEVLAGHFPFENNTAPDKDRVREALESKLKFAADYLLDDVAVNAQLQDFVLRMVKEHNPNDLLAVILSGHGNGAFGDFLPDEDPNSSLSIPDIGTFVRLLRIALYLAGGGPPIIDGKPVIENKGELKGFPPIHILGMDSCLMSTLEVCYEVRKHAKFLIGAEGFVPLSGWPYQRVLRALDESISGTVEDDVVSAAAVDRIVNSYNRYYSDYEDAGVSTDISAIRLNNVEEVKRTLDDLVTELHGFLSQLIGCPEPVAPQQFSHENLPLDELVELGETLDLSEGYDPREGRIVRNALVLARWYAQSYQFENQVDIWDFCNQLRRFLPCTRTFAHLHGLCEGVKTAVAAAVSQPNRWSGTEFQHSNGLSIYFPFSAEQFAPEYYNEHYDEEERKVVREGISFARESKWGCFLRAFLRLTRRVRRNQINHLASESDFNSFRRQGLLEDPLDVSAYSNYRVRSGGPFNTRSGGPFNTRSGGPFNTRSGGPFNTKGISSMAKNLPDGYYPENGREREREGE
jgi:hypothetical protein